MIAWRKCLCVLVSMALSGFFANLACAQRVDVTSIIEHPALDATANGIKDALKDAGYSKEKGFTWQFQTAQGNVSTAAQIARKYVGDKPDVMVGIGTPSAQALLAASKKIPLVFAAIADPVEAALVTSMDEPSGTNVTGVSNAVPLDGQIDLIQALVPNAKRVGFVYNPGEANSVSYLHRLQKRLPERGLELVVASAPRTVDVGTAANSLAGKVDVFYTSTDNNVVSAYEALVKVANQAKIPTVAADPSIAERGVVASLGVDYYALGVQTGHMIVRVLEGQDPGVIKPQFGRQLELIINTRAAKAQGVEVAQSLLDKADKVID